MKSSAQNAILLFNTVEADIRFDLVLKHLPCSHLVVVIIPPCKFTAATIDEYIRTCGYLWYYLPRLRFTPLLIRWWVAVAVSAGLTNRLTRLWKPRSSTGTIAGIYLVTNLAVKRDGGIFSGKLLAVSDSHRKNAVFCRLLILFPLAVKVSTKFDLS